MRARMTVSVGLAVSSMSALAWVGVARPAQAGANTIKETMEHVYETTQLTQGLTQSEKAYCSRGKKAR